MSVLCTPRGDWTKHTHLNVKTNALGKLLKHLFQCSERRLDEVSTAIAFEPLDFEITGVLHSFTHF